MLKKIDNFIIKDNSSFRLNDILKSVYSIKNKEDYLKYIENSNSNFKVLWELTNTVINPDVVNDIDLLLYKDNERKEDIIFLEDWTIVVTWNIKLKFLCTELLKKQYDCSYLIWIPWTIASAVVNNTWSWRLWESILDNVLKIEYYIKGKRYIKGIDDILYSYRNTEFKFMNNIFISRIYFTFNIINKTTLLDKIEKRYSDRSNLNEIYKESSLGTFYIKNSFLDYNNIISEDISINNNKIINYSSKALYRDYLIFKKKINPLYEVEIEEINKKYKNDYTWILIIDKNNNILLQKRDNNAHFNKNNISSSKILWPHGKYPMSTYIQNELLQSSNKKLYVQDKDLSFIDDSVELENGFKSLEYKIEYYRSIFDLIDKTEIYFPSDISSFIKSIKDRIQNNEPIFLEVNSKNDDKENFEKLANILLRIVINFGTLIININEDSLSYNRRVSQPLSEDKAGLGTLLSDLRDHIYNKKSNIFNCHGFQLKCDSYINSTEHHTFLVEYTKLLNNNTKNILQFKTANQSSLFKLDSNNLKSVHIPVIISKNFDYKFTYFDKKKKKDIIQSISYKKDQHVTEKEILDVNEIIKLAKEQGKIDDKIKAIEYSYEDVNLSYFNKLFVANNISKISQISNISSYLMQNEHLLKIEKHIGAYSFLAYLADTRNTWAHGDKQAWNRELFVEAFIYGFESIWLMQKFILENMYEQNNLPETKYVKLNDLEISDNRKKEFLSNFESLEKYQSYFNGLYKKVTNKND